MAITGAAAIAAGVAGTVGAVSTTAIMVAGLAITAVGVITKNSTLMKIGGGIGLGSGIAGAANGLSGAASAASAADSTGAAIQAPSIADAAGAGSQAAGDIAASNTPADLIAGYGSSAVDTGDGLINSAGVQSATDAAVNAGGQTASDAAQAPVDTSLNSAGNNSIAQNLTSQSPAQQAVQSSVAPNTNPLNTNAANVNAANVNPANAPDIATNTSAASPVAPGAQAAAGQTGSGAPMGFNSASAYAPVQNGLQAPSSWWSDLMQSMTDPKNNGVMQLAGGAVKGIGTGVGALIQGSMSGNMTDEQKWQQQNGSGAGAIPTVNIKPTGAASPYATPTQIQQRAAAAVQSTATPAYNGLINKAKGS